jgi:hypothetical protein
MDIFLFRYDRTFFFFFQEPIHYTSYSFLEVQRQKRETDISSPSVAWFRNTWSFTSTPCLRHRDTFYQTLFFCMTKFPVWEVAAEGRDYVVSSLCWYDVRNTRVCTWLAHCSAKCCSPVEPSSRTAIHTVIELSANYAWYQCNCWSITNRAILSVFWKLVMCTDMTVECGRTTYVSTVIVSISHLFF